jgi:uncharacterized membrane protein YhhN
MPERAPIVFRLVLLASLVAGISFYFIKDAHLPVPAFALWKGAGVALLAVWALLHRRDPNVLRLGLVMAFGASGDMLLEWNQAAGGAAFLLGHLEAISLYLRNRRTNPTGSQRLAAAALLLLSPLLAWQMTGSLAVTIYAAALGGMAASAWTSSFPRYRVGLGAVMFVASDLLIFAHMGVLANSPLPGLLIWPLYYFGQFMVCTGVIGALRTRST